MPAIGRRRHPHLGTGRARPRGAPAARLTLVVVCALFAAFALSGTASAADPVLSGSFDGSATPATSMTPQRMAVNERTGNVYVIDSANRVIDVFDSTGRYLSQLDGRNTTAGSFNFGGDDDIAIDNTGGSNDGNVYVNVENAGLIFAFDASGNFLWQSNANVTDPCGIAVDPSGNPWYGDFTNGLQQLSVADGSAVGSPILRTGDSCHFAFDSAGNILLNHWGSTVDKYDASGTLITHVDNGTSLDVAVDRSSDDIYTDEGLQIKYFDPSGTALTGGFGPASLNSTGVAVNGSNGKIYVGGVSTGTVYIYDFVPDRRLSVTVGGASGGSVSADSGAISGCTRSGGTCSDRYASGTTVTLTATPDAGAGVTWTGCDSTSGNQCIVTLTADTNVTASFDPTHTLSVTKGGTGSGSVSSSPSGITCWATCSALFVDGTDVTLTATPAATSTFAGWSGGGCSGTGTCRVTLGSDTTVTATFAQDAPSITTGSASGISQTGATVSGTVNPNGANVTDCHVDYGTSTAYGSSAPCAAGPGSGTSGVGVSATLSGLSAGTTYHYRVVATNLGGTTAGGDATFATAATPTCATDASLCPPPPPHRTVPGTFKLVGASTVTLSGTSVKVKLACSGDTACSATVKLTMVKVVGKGKHRHKANVVIASKKVTIAAGTTASVKLTLSKAARKLVVAKHSLRTTLVAGKYKHTLVVKAPKKKHKK